MGGESIAPYWVEDIERVRADLDDIEKKSIFKVSAFRIVGALETIYKDRVSAVFDDKIKQCDAQIASYTQNLTKIFHKCESRLKNLQKRRFPSFCSWWIEYTNETEARIFKNVQKGLASRLQDLSMTYRKKQKQFFQKLRSVGVCFSLSCHVVHRRRRRPDWDRIPVVTHWLGLQPISEGRDGHDEEGSAVPRTGNPADWYV